MGDGQDSQKFRDFTVAFMKEAKEDLEVAEELIDNKRYSRAVSSSQQCVEKAVKALLEMEKVFVAEHDLSTFFVKFVYNNKGYGMFKEKIKELLEILDYFEGEWSKTRYPKEQKGKIVIPIEIYKAEDASIAYDKAQKCYNFVKDILIVKFKFGKDELR